MFPQSYFLFTPVTRADDAFPSVFSDKQFSYGSSPTIESKISALRDLERAFQLLDACVYEMPLNYTSGLEKIVEHVGGQLNGDGSNATSVRKRLEQDAYPKRKSCICGFLQGMRRVFERKPRQRYTTDVEDHRVVGQPDPHAYAKFRMRCPDAGP